MQTFYTKIEFHLNTKLISQRTISRDIYCSQLASNPWSVTCDKLIISYEHTTLVKLIPLDNKARVHVNRNLPSFSNVTADLEYSGFIALQCPHHGA